MYLLITPEQSVVNKTLFFFQLLKPGGYVFSSFSVSLYTFRSIGEGPRNILTHILSLYFCKILTVF